MNGTHEPGDSSNAPEVDRWRVQNLFEEFFAKRAGKEVATTKQKTTQNLNQSDNQNLSMQPAPSSKTQIYKPNPDIFSCDVCTYQTKNMSEYIKHKQTHEKRHNFECPIHKQVFKMQATVVKHMKVNRTNKEPNDVMISCSTCDGKFKTKFSFDRHYDCVHDLCKCIKYRCDKCAFVTNHKNYFDTHKKVHVDSSEFECRNCGGKFTTLWSLSAHYKNVHNEFINVTHHCNEYSINYKNHLDKQKRTHVDSTDSRCSHCKEKFKTKLVLSENYKTLHVQSKRIYSCKLCAYLTEHKLNLTIHKSTHVHISYYVCIICGGKFEKQIVLENHYLEVHQQSYSDMLSYNHYMKRNTKTQDGLRKFNCKICKKDFWGRDLLIHLKLYHMWNLENVESNISQNLPTPKTHNLPFHCTSCQEYFGTEESFKQHKANMHLTQACLIKKVHICFVCHKQFKTTKSLHCHIKEHKDKIHNRNVVSNETFYCEICKHQFETKKDFERHNKDNHQYMTCRICSQQFSTIESLKRHHLTHDEHAYRCPNCYVQFKTIDSLYIHTQEHRDKIYNRIGDKKTYSNLFVDRLKTWNINQKNIDQAGPSKHQPSKSSVIPDEDKLLELSIHRNIEGDSSTDNNSLCINRLKKRNVSSSKETDQAELSAYQCSESSQVSREDVVDFRETKESDSSTESDVKRNISQELHVLEVHDISRSPDSLSPVTCNVCFKQFPTVESLIKHMTTYKPKVENICSICHKSCETQKSLNSHIQEHENRLLNCTDANIMHYCELCELYFETKENFIRHNEKHHPTATCHICLKQFLTVGSLIKHMPTHKYETESVCSICNKWCESKQTLNLHMRKHKSKVHNCIGDKKTYSYDSNLSVKRQKVQNVSGLEKTDQPGPPGYQPPESSKSREDIVDSPTVHNTEKSNHLAQNDTNILPVNIAEARNVSSPKENDRPEPSRDQPPKSSVTPQEDIAVHLPKDRETEKLDNPAESDNNTLFMNGPEPRDVRSSEKTRKPKPPTYQCNICKNKFIDKVKFTRHLTKYSS